MEIDDAIQVLKDPDSWLTLDYDWGEPEACADHRLIVACQMGANALAKRQWIPVSERLPESGEHVLLCCEVRPSMNKYVCDGFYATAKSEEVGWSCEGESEYDEETDEYYLPEGFYEVIKNWDEWSSIVLHDFVTHWMPLPEPPKGG